LIGSPTATDAMMTQNDKPHAGPRESSLGSAVEEDREDR
jgi:hypothetical protein